MASIADLMMNAMRQPTPTQKLGNALIQGDQMRRQNRLADLQEKMINNKVADSNIDRQIKKTDFHAKFASTYFPMVQNEQDYQAIKMQAAKMGYEWDGPDSLMNGGADWMRQQYEGGQKWLSASNEAKLQAFAPVEMTVNGQTQLAVPIVDQRTGQASYSQLPAPDGATITTKRAQPFEIYLGEQAKTQAKLQTELKLQPQVAAEVARATAIASQQVDLIGEQRSNEKALAVYDQAMTGLAQSLSGADTGPIVGWIPAVTTNKQIADGAVAAMAPVLKDLFRGAGEGTFTDKDQELLLEMVPTRTDTPEARVAKIKNIDAIVRAKLSTSQPQPNGGTIDRTQPAGGGVKFLGFE